MTQFLLSKNAPKFENPSQSQLFHPQNILFYYCEMLLKYDNVNFDFRKKASKLKTISTNPFLNVCYPQNVVFIPILHPFQNAVILFSLFKSLF